MNSDDLHAWPSYAQLLTTALRRFPDETALVEDSRSVSYRQLEAEIEGVSSAFHRMGLSAGDGIAQLSQNSVAAVVVQLAAYRCGLRFIPLHPMGSVEDHAYILDDAEVVALVHQASRFADNARQLAQAAPGVRMVVAHEEGAAFPSIASFAAAVPDVPELAQEGESVVTILYTGGTTGKSKGVVLTNRCMVLNALLCLAEWEWPRDIRFLCVTPITHASGCMIVPILLRGGTIYLHAGFHAGDVLRDIERFDITATFMVPTMIYMLLDHPGSGAARTGSLELVIYGGSAISPARLDEALGRFGQVFMQIYSQSEAPNFATAMRRAEHLQGDLERLSSCGRPLSGITVRLLDEEGNPVERGDVGEICFRGPSIMRHYWKKPQESAETLSGGWLHTGDMARQDSDGFIYIVDRRKDMIVTGGFNVYPREIEDVLTEHAGVAAAAVIGVPDPKWGEAVKAVVVRRADAEIDQAALIRYVRDRKGAVAAPKSVEFVDALPLTPLGKPDKKELRQRYWSGQARQVN
ncbi:MAG: AMP-binding protein [Flavobacteriaceae bacterium]